MASSLGSLGCAGHRRPCAGASAACRPPRASQLRLAAIPWRHFRSILSRATPQPSDNSAFSSSSSSSSPTPSSYKLPEPPSSSSSYLASENPFSDPQRRTTAPDTKSPQAGRPKTKRVWAIGVDFGTYGSGYAFKRIDEVEEDNGAGGAAAGAAARGDVPSSKHPDSSPMMCCQSWPDRPAPDVKTRSAILYDKYNKVAAWGWTAWKRWSEMNDAERREGGFTYLDSFKLLLLPPPEEAAGARAASSAGVAGDVVPPLPPGLTAVQVVADYLTEMRRYVYKKLAEGAKADGAPAPDPASLVWCLTVPAMWDESAKAKMRRAANRAGMALSSDPTLLQLVLEPEAAAVSATRQLSAPSKAATGSAGAAAPKLRDGDVVLVLDCGGGTADMTLHRVVGSGSRLQLEEAAVGQGEAAGGVFVDRAAWLYVRSVVGPLVWDSWRERRPAEWTQLANKWEMAKRQPGPVQLQLPPGLVDMVRQRQQDVAARSPTNAMFDPESRTLRGRTRAASSALVERLTASSSSSSSGASPSSNGAGPTPHQHQPQQPQQPLSADGVLVLSESVLAAEVFGPVVERILGAAERVVEEGARAGNNCNKVMLVGGFANSAYLQRRVRELADRRGVPLLLPPNPSAAVVTGAVILGERPSRISARRCRFTYGIACRSIWTDDDAASNTAFGYPPKIWKEEDNNYFADDVFELYVRRGQLVQVDEVVQRTFCPTSSKATAIAIDLYSTPREFARYIAEPGMCKAANVMLHLPVGWNSRVANRQDYAVEVELRFGGTELTLLARDPQSKNSETISVQWRPELVMAGGGK